MKTKRKPSTPLPWKSAGLSWLLVDETTERYHVETFSSNAAYAVHAANAYPKLVERLREILAYQPGDEKTAAILRELGEIK